MSGRGPGGPGDGGPDTATDGGRTVRRAGGRRDPGISFGARELRDLAVAWLALGVAFTFFLSPEVATALQGGSVETGTIVEVFALSLLTVGVAFLLHELAHKVVAVRFGQLAAFRADYGMLFLAVMAGMAGFFFAAPGAVVHRGRITKRENGLISLAGPVTNLVLAVVFAPLMLVGGFVGAVGSMGVTINLLLAGFNMLPYGPLDGRKVLDWSTPVFAAVAVPSFALAVYALFFIGL
jgi:Zn-dependent protease